MLLNMENTTKIITLASFVLNDKIDSFNQSAVAWSKAGKHIESAIAYGKTENHIKLREEIISFITKTKKTNKSALRIAAIYLLGIKAKEVAANWNLNSQLQKIIPRLKAIHAKQEIEADLQKALQFAKESGDKGLTKKIQDLGMYHL